MFFKKKGMPESGDIVLCTVKKILFHSVFVTLDEYNNLEGLIHISEVSPGRIRNLRDFVKEDKKIVCKVLRINFKGHIDLSLRRVNKSQRILKLTSVKQEEKAEKLLKFIGKQLKKDLKGMYDLIGHKVIEKYGSLNYFFETLVVDPDVLKEFKLDKKVNDLLLTTVKDKIKIPEVKVGGILSLSSYEPFGVEDIKKVLSGIETDNVMLSYVSAPNYKIDIKGQDYKTVEGILKNILDNLSNVCKKLKINMGFTKSG